MYISVQYVKKNIILYNMSKSYVHKSIRKYHDPIFRALNPLIINNYLGRDLVSRFMHCWRERARFRKREMEREREREGGRERERESSPA